MAKTAKRGKSRPANGKRGRGRPKVNATPMQIRLRPNELKRLDSAIEHHGGELSRPEAIRRVIEHMAVDAIR